VNDDRRHLSRHPGPRWSGGQVTRRASLDRGRDEVVAIAITSHRHEQLTTGDLAAVMASTVHLDIGAGQLTTGDPSDLGGREAHGPHRTGRTARLRSW